MQLINCDCLDVMRTIPPSSIDLVLTDPPYGTTQIEWDKPLDWDEIWKEIKRITKPNAAIILFSSQPFTTDLIQSNRKMFRYEIIWEKTLPSGFLNAKRMPLRTHENILVFYKNLPTYNPQKSKVKRSDVGRERHNSGRANQYNEFRNDDWRWVEDGTRYPTDVIKFSNWNGALFGKTDKATKHPTQKPVGLLEYLIKTYSDQGDTVLDFTMGSGSTGIACANTNRNFIGIELDAGYFKLADTRISDAIKMQNDTRGMLNDDGREVIAHG